MNIDLINEVWVDIYDGYYQVSNFGRVKSSKRDNSNKKYGRVINEYVLKPQKHYKNGYLSVLIKIGKFQKRHTVHSLVANCFVQKKDCSFDEINHIDGNKSNNHYKNLEWCDRSMNNSHAYLLGLRQAPNSKSLVSIQDSAILEFKSLSECSRYLGVNRRIITKALKSGCECKGHKIYTI